MAVMRPELIMKCIVPVVMAGIIAIYGLVVAVLIGNSMDPKNYSLFEYVGTPPAPFLLDHCVPCAAIALVYLPAHCVLDSLARDAL